MLLSNWPQTEIPRLGPSSDYAEDAEPKKSEAEEVVTHIDINEQVAFLANLPTAIINALADKDIQKLRDISAYPLTEEEINHTSGLIKELLGYPKHSILSEVTTLSRNPKYRYPLEFLASISPEAGDGEVESSTLKPKLISYCILFNKICKSIPHSTLLGTDAAGQVERDAESYKKTQAMGDTGKANRLNYF